MSERLPTAEPSSPGAASRPQPATLALLVLALAAAAPSRALAQEQPGVKPVEERVPSADGRRTMGRLPLNLALGAVGVFHPDNLVPALVGSAAAAGASTVDEQVRDHVAGHSGWGESFETAGGAAWSTGFTVGMFTVGRFTHGRFRAMTYDMLDAAVVTFAYTSALKYAVGRERPNGSDNKSFPSGHTSNAFTLATVAQKHYGWKVGVPAYLLAATMGASRIKQDKHWFSDVVAGATLGYIGGRTVVRVNGGPLKKGGGTTVSVAPIVSPRMAGFRLGVVF
jgi:hypothetical protein